MRLPTLILLTLLNGCAGADHEIKRTEFALVIRVDPVFLDRMGSSIRGDIHGVTFFNEITQTCSIYLRRYPDCLLHEIRHCIEGQWHPGRNTMEDC